MKKFTFWRNAIIAETYVVEAATESEARELVMSADPVRTEWMDWHSDQFELEEIEIIEPLYAMVKNYKERV